MVAFAFPGEPVIDSTNFHLFTQEHLGDKFCFGAVPRDYARNPVGSYAGIAPYNGPLIPWNEMSSRIKDKIQAKAQLSDIIMSGSGNNGVPVPFLHQNGQGYCWCYSPGNAMTAVRARDGQPYVELSPHGLAWLIKKGKDEGGWNPLAVEQAIKLGYPLASDWPARSMDGAKYNNETTWKNAQANCFVDVWMDINPPVYDRNLTLQQLATCLILNIPCPVDYMWQGHSVCALDFVEVDPTLPLSDVNRWGVRIWNSWKDWGRNGMGIYVGSKCVPDGATACKGTLQLAA